ncbi:MAG: DUF6076 domain-containing protein [Clostridiales bacterium]|jgi:hypothetical protein|nr:DUF6076 domain-containing protein [Clostridiales bacterium]
MRILFREKSETLDIGNSGWRENFDLSYFIFEFLAVPLPSLGRIERAEPAQLRGLLERFLLDALTVSETFFFLLWAEIEGDLRDFGVEGFPISESVIGRLCAYRGVFAARRSDFPLEDQADKPRVALFAIFDKLGVIARALETACLFCLDRDMALHDGAGLSAAHKWYIFERLVGAENPLEIISKYSAVSESTVVEAADPSAPTGVLDAADDSGGRFLEFFGDPANSDIYKSLAAREDIETARSFASDSILGLIYAEFWNMIINNVTLKTCAFCGKYFIPFSGNSEYCGRLIPGKNKTCREYAPMYFHRKKDSKNELAKLLKRADSAHYMRHKRNPQHYTWDQFTAWRDKAARLLEKAQAGLISETEFSAAIKPNTIK